VKDITWIITLVVAGILFAIAWRKGYLMRLSGYVGETREELKKCNWPSTEELKESTLVVMVVIAMLGFFTMAVDVVFRNVVQALL